MAELRCPKCGKSNPDLLDVCQFCQTPLKSDSVLRIGDAPTKKDTGELEAVLPKWLKDVRQQARSSAEEEAAQEAVQPKVEKNEPPDLLAGLASQSGDAGDDDIPDWLASINPVAGPKSVTHPAGAVPSAPAPESESDFFAQFRQSEAAPASKPEQEEPPAAPAREAPSSDSTDELSRWFSQASEQPEETVEIDPNARRQDESAWLSGFDSPEPSRPEPASKEPEDLSWLHNLEEASKQTGDLQAPKPSKDWTADFEAPSAPSGPSGSQEDLSWLDNLAGIEEPQQPATGQPSTPPFVQPTAKDEDLSWLNNLGADSEPQPFDAAPEKPASAQPFVSDEDLSWLSKLGAPEEPSQPAATTPAFSAPPQEDLGWLNELGGTDEPSQPAAPAPEIVPSSQDDLGWLNQLGETAEPSQSVEAVPGSSSQDDLSWLNEFGGQSGAQSTPPFAEPESTLQATPPFKTEDAEPDWLKSAVETPSAPSSEEASLDWFTDKSQPVDHAPSAERETPQPSPALASDASVDQTQGKQTPATDAFSIPSEAPTVSGQEFDALFSAEMPDWLSRAEPSMGEPAAQGAGPLPAEGADSLAPVELPSWVQAMRPVEAVISETAAGTEEPEEKEGPLAGLRGVIPGISLGPSSRPKSISLKLQATDEQQASAALLERILGSETSPRALVTSPFIWSQRWLRRTLAVLFWLVLGLIIAFRSNALPISSEKLPAEMQPAADIVGSIPEGGRVLVIADYEPALAGEMEAVGGPVLAHMTSLRHPTLSFVSTSSSGPGLVERLMTNTKINVPVSDDGAGGFGYVAGDQYFNLGYLPGGSAGALGFVKRPSQIIPATGVQSLSEYAAIILMTDQAESGRVWVEQLYAQKQIDPLFADDQPLLVIASAQADPLLQPYVSSRQINGIVSGLSDAGRYESVIVVNASPKTARSYWDAFGIGLTMAIAMIIFGSLWSLFTGIRARRAESEQG